MNIMSDWMDALFGGEGSAVLEIDQRLLEGLAAGREEAREEAHGLIV